MKRTVPRPSQERTIMSEPRERTQWEKARGMAWMFGSLLIAGVIVTAAMQASKWAGAGYELGLVLAAIIAMDAHVFRWGVRRFDITPPKYFRHPADTGGKEDSS